MYYHGFAIRFVELSPSNGPFEAVFLIHKQCGRPEGTCLPLAGVRASAPAGEPGAPRVRVGGSPAGLPADYHGNARRLWLQDVQRGQRFLSSLSLLVAGFLCCGFWLALWLWWIS